MGSLHNVHQVLPMPPTRPPLLQACTAYGAAAPVTAVDLLVSHQPCLTSHHRTNHPSHVTSQHASHLTARDHHTDIQIHPDHLCDLDFLPPVLLAFVCGLGGSALSVVAAAPAPAVAFAAAPVGGAAVGLLERMPEARALLWDSMCSSGDTTLAAAVLSRTCTDHSADAVEAPCTEDTMGCGTAEL